MKAINNTSTAADRGRAVELPHPIRRMQSGQVPLENTGEFLCTWTANACLSEPTGVANRKSSHLKKLKTHCETGAGICNA